MVTLPLQLLARKEGNVATTKKEVARCLETVECHKRKVHRLRAAVEAMGIETKNSPPIISEEKV